MYLRFLLIKCFTKSFVVGNTAYQASNLGQHIRGFVLLFGRIGDIEGFDMSSEKQDCGEFRVNGWHLKKEVTIGQLVTIVMILVSGLWWASSVETRISGLSAEDRRIEEKTELIIQSVIDHIGIYQKDTIRALGRIDRSIGKLSDKLDRKADK